MKSRTLLVISTTGLLSGLINGLIGVGGGTIVIPAMVHLLGIAQHQAHGTSLAIILPTCLTSAAVYAYQGFLPWNIILTVTATGMLGAYLGARCMNCFSPKGLRQFFGLFMVLAGVRMLWPGSFLPDGSIMPSFPFLYLLGLLAGFLSGMAVGGGTLLVPALIILFDVVQHQAQGVSLTAFLPMSAVAVHTHWRQGNVLPRIAAYLAIGSVIGAILGALTAAQLPAPVLRKIFGGFLLLMGTYEIFMKPAREQRHAKTQAEK